MRAHYEPVARLPLDLVGTRRHESHDEALSQTWSPPGRDALAHGGSLCDGPIATDRGGQPFGVALFARSASPDGIALALSPGGRGSTGTYPSAMRVLLTGMSGSGKSTLVQELRRRGYAAYDADDDGFSEPRADGR